MHFAGTAVPTAATEALRRTAPGKPGRTKVARRCGASSTRGDGNKIETPRWGVVAHYVRQYGSTSAGRTP